MSAGAAQAWRPGGWQAAPPPPDPPEKAAGVADEVTYLRSRGFAVVSAGKDLPGF